VKERAGIRRLDVKRDVNNSEKMKINKKIGEQI